VSDEFRLRVDPPWRARYAALEERVARLERVLDEVATYAGAAVVRPDDRAAIRAELQAAKEFLEASAREPSKAEVAAELPAAVEASDADTDTPHRIESER
jgi:hypothetical protein